ncbi:threonine/serine exporter family protein [Nakamurella leprariae]|uniref:Threonine/serine exporter family protein n=1 Tax=Nakamurella leprariae TaxID=2803911 RepID=A0A939C056_9ACTN|nr:threonine/serine exporter family protein [Nakamurella leprariae]MBM9468880.1 threonine/serine exporter family protein [Nakamurella leprariae]
MRTDPEAAADLTAAAVAGLLANGAESERIAERAAQVAGGAGGTATVTLGWSESSVTTTVPGHPPVERRFSAAPSVVGMNRVVGIDHAVNDFSGGRKTVRESLAAIDTARRQPLANVWLFAAACAVGACALAVIFGIDHWQGLLAIAVSAGLGAFVRRGIGRLGGSNFWQAGVAAFLAGLIGALAVDLDVSSPLRLIAVCPCMVLVPGPHLLNGAFDLAAGRIPLGLARLTFATVTLVAIAAGLLLGLAAGGATLVLDPAGREIPIALDALAGGVVAVCYGVFYSAPLRILIWPFLVGAGVHALRWVAIYHWHVESWVGAGLACLVAGFVLVPVSRRLQLPFSAIGFASVVSLMPGLLVFRTLAALSMLQDATGAQATELVQSAVDNANVAALTVMAMAIGFIVPTACYGLVQRLRTGTPVSW